VVGDAGNAVVLPHLAEKRRTVAFAIEDDHEAAEIRVGLQLFVGRLTGNVFQQTRHDVAAQGLQHPVVNRTFDREERLAEGVIDPVVGRATQAQTLPRDVTLGQFRQPAVIEPHVAIDIQRAGQFRVLFHPLLGQRACPALRSFVLAELGYFIPQATHFRNAIQAHQLAELSGRLVLESFHDLDAAQGHVGQQQNHVELHVVAGEFRQGPQMAKQTVCCQGW